jgi:hypothetical protein
MRFGVQDDFASPAQPRGCEGDGAGTGARS